MYRIRGVLVHDNALYRLTFYLIYLLNVMTYLTLHLIANKTLELA